MSVEDGRCHPTKPLGGGVRACMVTLAADVRGGRGQLSYEWSGCASGQSRQATCSVNDLRRFKAKVVVRDGQGNTGSGSGFAEGVNQAPVIYYNGPKGPLAARSFFPTVGGQPEDPDGDEDPNELCGRKSLDVSGPCHAGFGLCGGLADAMDIDLTTTNGPGTCALDIRVWDRWGAVGRKLVKIEVLP